MGAQRLNNCRCWSGAQHERRLAEHRVPGLSDRVVIVTGAGQGIGRVFAKSFAMAGARAIIAEVNEKKAAARSRRKSRRLAARRWRSPPTSPILHQSRK